jgi:excisionase family DNA binding protein
MQDVSNKTETAQFLRVSKATVDRLVKKGLLKRTKLSERKVGFLKSDIQAYLASGGGIQ